MEEALFRDDCSQCAALCCVAFSFEKSALFAFDKQSGIACTNLTGQGRCKIHHQLDNAGFTGCVQYTCLGAGQRVTQELFAGQSWQQTPSLLEPMMAAFQAMRQIHELLQLLNEAAKLALDPPKQQRLEQLADSLQPQQGWTLATLSAFERSPISQDISIFLGTLRENIVKNSSNIKAQE